MSSYFKPCIRCGRGIVQGVKKCPHCGKSNSLLSRIVTILRFALRKSKKLRR